MGICSFSSPQPIGVSFRFRKCKFRNISRNAIQHSAVDIWSGLPAPARDFHRPGPPLLQASQWHPRVAKRASIGTLARGASTEALLGQGRVPKERESVPLTGLWSGSRPGLARHPRLQVVLRHPGVAKRTSIGTSARRPYPQVPQWHPRGATVSWCTG